MARRVRRVRTAEGARKYDLPIGAIITADAIAKAKAKAGGAPSTPKTRRQARLGMTPKAPKAQAPAAPKAKAAPAAPAPVAPAPKPQSVKELRDSGHEIRTSPSGVQYAISPAPNQRARVFDAEGNEVPLDEVAQAELAKKLTSEESGWENGTMSAGTPAPDAPKPAAPVTPPAPNDTDSDLQSSLVEQLASGTHPRDIRKTITASEEFKKATPEQRKATLRALRSAERAKATSLGKSVQFSSSDSAEIMQKRDKNWITASYIGEDGALTEDGEKMVDAVIADFLIGVAPAEEPVAYFNSGGPASGKGSLSDPRRLGAITQYPESNLLEEDGKFTFADQPGAVLNDPDMLKRAIPEVKQILDKFYSGQEMSDQEKDWAAASHELSSLMSKRLVQASYDRRVNLILDGVNDGSIAKATKKVDEALDNGYAVELNVMYLEPDEGLRRALGRGERTGRFVPNEVILDGYAGLPAVVDAQLRDPRIRTVRVFNNNGDGDAQQMLERRGNEQTDWFDAQAEEAYQAFLDSAAKAKALIDRMNDI